MAMFVIAGSFRISGAQPDGDSIRFDAAWNHELLGEYEGGTTEQERARRCETSTPPQS
jgi:hypothetical protein